jgi:hypothetical protein
VVHSVHNSFQVSGIRQHEAAEVVARKKEDEFARQSRDLPRRTDCHHPFPNVLSLITRHPHPALAPSLTTRFENLLHAAAHGDEAAAGLRLTVRRTRGSI